MLPENGLAVIAIKVAGALSGTIMALVFQPPKTKPEFFTRSVFSMLSGLLFSEPARDMLKWSDTWEHRFAAVALVALSSWWVWGAAVRIIGNWKPKD